MVGIVDKSMAKFCKFKDLSEGQTFKYSGNVYIKIHPRSFARKGVQDANAVNITDSAASHFGACTSVIKVQAELIVIKEI